MRKVKGDVGAEGFEHVVRSNSRGLRFNFREVAQYRDLIFLFVKRDFVSLYKQTILGPLWAIIQPFLTTVVFSLFFGEMAGLGAEGVPGFVFYYCGTIIWTYFSNCLTKTSTTFISNSAILGKVYFPRLVVPISTVLSNLIMLGIQLCFLVLFILYYALIPASIHPNLYMLMLPLLILQLAILSMGFGVIISSLTTKYRDLNMLVSFGVSLWMYATPVAYDMFRINALTVGGKWHFLYMCNPVTPIINIFRYGFLGYGTIEWKSYAISWGVTLLVFALGTLLFNRVEKTFMDTV